MPDKTQKYTEATRKVGAGKKSPHQVLSNLRTRLQEMLKEVEEALVNSEGWHDGMAIETVHRQIDEARWRN